MTDTMIATHLENLDRRLARVEQILPTLATRDEVKTLATKEDLKTLATKEDLNALATKEELRLAVQEEGERSRRYMDVLTESLREDIHLIAGHVASAKPKGTEP